MNPNFEIGKLLFEVIDFVRSANKVQRKSNKCHFLEKLIQKPSPSPLTKTYWELVEKLIAHPSIKDSASETVIREELSPIILLDKNRKRIRELYPEAAGQEIINNLTRRRFPQLVIFPLEGFLPREEVSTIGNITFGVYKDILDYYQAPEYQLPKDDESHAKEKKYIWTITSNKEKEISNYVCVGTKVNACYKTAAIYLAEKQINLVLNIIRLLIPLYDKTINHPRISISDLTGFSKVYIISMTDGRRDLSGSDLHLTWPFIFPPSYTHKEKKAIDTASAIASKDPNERSDFEDRILKAINWAGEGIDSIEKDVKVVKCVIALEVLFKIGDKKQRNFIKYVNRLFSHYSGNNSLIKKQAKKIYKLRSAIVHGGKRDITDEDAEWAECIACGCILRTLEKMDNFKTEEDFRNCLKIRTEK